MLSLLGTVLSGPVEHSNVQYSQDDHGIIQGKEHRVHVHVHNHMQYVDRNDSMCTVRGLLMLTLV